jgi:hypothetical protein
MSVLAVERQSEDIIQKIRTGVYTIDYFTGRLQVQ